MHQWLLVQVVLEALFLLHADAPGGMNLNSPKLFQIVKLSFLLCSKNLQSTINKNKNSSILIASHILT